MSLFRREDELEGSMNRPVSATPKPRPQAPTTTVVAAGTNLVGEVTGSASLIVDGQVDGKVHLENEVAVGKAGLVKGEIKARAVRIGGKVRGNIEGLEMIEIMVDGSVEGDLRSPRVVIADGAFFKGKVEMGASEPVPKAATAPQTPSAAPAPKRPVAGHGGGEQ